MGAGAELRRRGLTFWPFFSLAAGTAKQRDETQENKEKGRGRFLFKGRKKELRGRAPDVGTDLPAKSQRIASFTLLRFGGFAAWPKILGGMRIPS